MYDRLVARKGYDNSWQDDLHRLYHELLPESARLQLKGAKVVVVVPQHILHYFPFAALVTQTDSKAAKTRMAQPRFLLDESFDLVYAPSLLSWRRLPAAMARQVWAIGVAEVPGAPALAGVKKDIANLQTVFGPSVKKVIDGDDASVLAAKKLFNQRGLLFFGTHGLNLADQPLESHLLLLPDETETAGETNDGRLTAAQLFARKINAEIVVMSACYSGLGDRSPLPGDDLFGLQRAFLQSGVRTVVSGLWDVYDGTAPELMHGMFEELAAGRTAVAALANSQRTFVRKLRKTKEDEPWLHPYFWAVYTAAGDDRTRFEK
jgi:CHAT domain-containing protein